jgi:hypothetical protein
VWSFRLAEIQVIDKKCCEEVKFDKNRRERPDRPLSELDPRS